MTDVAATTGSAASAAGWANRSGIGRARWRLANLTLPELWIVLAVALPALAALAAPMSTVDLAWQLRAGNEILANTAIPDTNLWTLNTGAPWTDQQWGAQIVLAVVHNVFGWTGLVVLGATLVGAIFAAVAISILRRNPAIGLRTAAWLTLGSFLVASPSLALRPQLFGIAAFAASLLILSDRRDHPRPVWLLVPIAAIWANLHGSFVLAPVLPLLAFLEDRAERRPRASRLLVVAAATAVATLLNPFGIGVWAYALGLAGDATVTGLVSEWQPPSLRTPDGLLFWVSLGAVVVFLARRGSRTPWWALVTLAVFALLAAWAVRGLAWWAIVAAVTAGTLMGAGARERRERGSPINGAIVAMIVLVGIVLLPVWRGWDAQLQAPAGLLRHAPPGITAWLRDNVEPGQRIWNPQVWGSWFEYAVPDGLYALDSRVELIPAHTLQADAALRTGSSWCFAVGSGDIRTIILEDPAASFVGQQLASGGWTLAYEDADGTIWRHPIGAFDSDCMPGPP